MEVKIKTCPFCGAKALPEIRYETSGDGDITVKIKCTFCGARTQKYRLQMDARNDIEMQEDFAIEKAAEAWNKRT